MSRILRAGIVLMGGLGSLANHHDGIILRLQRGGDEAFLGIALLVFALVGGGMVAFIGQHLIAKFYKDAKEGKLRESVNN